MKFKMTDILVCPHCKKTEDTIAEDYIRITPPDVRPVSHTDCGWCDGKFSVQKTEDGMVEVIAKN